MRGAFTWDFGLLGRVADLHIGGGNGFAAAAAAVFPSLLSFDSGAQPKHTLDLSALSILLCSSPNPLTYGICATKEVTIMQVG